MRKYERPELKKGMQVFVFKHGAPMAPKTCLGRGEIISRGTKRAKMAIETPQGRKTIRRSVKALLLVI